MRCSQTGSPSEPLLVGQRVGTLLEVGRAGGEGGSLGNRTLLYFFYPCSLAAEAPLPFLSHLAKADSSTPDVSASSSGPRSPGCAPAHREPVSVPTVPQGRDSALPDPELPGRAVPETVPLTMSAPDPTVTRWALVINADSQLCPGLPS